MIETPMMPLESTANEGRQQINPQGFKGGQKQGAYPKEGSPMILPKGHPSYNMNGR